MKIGDLARKRHLLTFLLAAFAWLAAPQAVFAQDAGATTEAAAADASAPAADSAADAGSTFQHYGPDMIKGQPSPGAITFQKQYSPNGEYALWMHNALLMPIITFIVLLVLGLLLWVVTRYNRRANPVASKTSHNTLIEVLWTGIPLLILVVIAVPSITLLSRQFKSPPEDALTVKVTGYQWYWGYSYPDNGGFEVISNMMPDEEAVQKGLPPQLAVDNRMVVPVGVPIRIQTFGSDVIHSFSVPSLWFKLDAVPGRLNERLLYIEEPGIYYGQCSELCGARHGFMPIAVEAVPMPQYEAWVRSQGGTVGGEGEAATAVPATTTPASAVEGAPAAGEEPSPQTPVAGTEA